MPHDVTMPQLGMAQDAGRIVAWLKAPGDAVSKGDALFEVETDKATMEVEAQAGGFLTGVMAAEGDDVPVGAVIARITETAENPAPEARPEPEPEDAAAGDLPQGRTVTMPQLGMAQDSGVLVGWLKTLGDAVAADDLLFEVETDKATMEVEAGADGFLAATLADAGDEVPVGGAMAIISGAKPDAPVARSASSKAAPSQASAPKASPAAKKTATQPQARKPPPPAVGADTGRILASPKARRLALEQGLDLSRLVDAGHAQPFHVRDLEALKALPAAPAKNAAAGARRIVAEVADEELRDFIAWAAEAHGMRDADAILAGLAGGVLTEPGPVAVERGGRMRTFSMPPSRALSQVGETDEAPSLVLRDLRGSPLRSVEMGGEAVPVLTLTSGSSGLTLTLECSPAQLDAQAAVRLLTAFAGRAEQPLRHLL